MILTMYSIHDRKAQLYNRPFFETNEVVAIRNVEMAFGEGALAYAPSDFELVKLGTYDDETGKYDILAIPELVEINKGV